MKNLKILFIVFSAVLFFTACEKEESSKLWTISGEVRMQDAQTPEITSPLEGITVYLFNLSNIIDSTSTLSIQSDVIDYTQTNENGVYTFSAVEPGEFIVMAVDTTVGYRFIWSDSPDPIGFKVTNSQIEYAVNFETPEPVMENDNSKFEFKFFNLRDDELDHYYSHGGVFRGFYGDKDFYKKIRVFRRARVAFGYGWFFTNPGPWYWKPDQQVMNYRIEDINDPEYGYDTKLRDAIEQFDSPSLFLDKDASTWLYQYKDEFLVKFYKDKDHFTVLHDWMHSSYSITVAGSQLHELNDYKVRWFNDEIRVYEIDE